MKRLLFLLAFCLCALPPASSQNINISKAERVRICEVHIWGTGTAGVLQDTDDEAASCYNGYGVSMTVTAVRCWADAGSPTVLPTNEGVSGHNLITGNLTCGTASFLSADGQSGRPSLTATGADLVVPAGGTIGGVIVSAGGTAKSIRLVIEMKI